MGLFDKFKKTTIQSRRYEEKLYEVALEEVKAGDIRKGLYAKALSKADGDKGKADGIYLKLRVQSIMDDIESDQINRRENDKALQAIKSLEGEIVVKSTSDLKTECEHILRSKGYALRKRFMSEKWFVTPIDDKNWNYFSSTHLSEVKKWAENADNKYD